MDERATFPDWPTKRDALRRHLAARRPRHDHTGPLRPAPGAVVEPGGVAATIAARAAFFGLAGDVQPALLTELAGEPLDEYDAVWEENGGPPDADLEFWAPTTRRLHIQFMARLLDSTGPMMAWATRWGFPVTFDPPESSLRDEQMVLRHVVLSSWGMSLAGFTVHRWRVLPLAETQGQGLVDSLTRAAETADTNLGLATSLALPAVAWDPQREDRATATARILAELGRSVRAELEHIETAAREVAEPAPVKRTGLEHLAWLARYQFRRESFTQIAKDAPVGRQAVADGVQAAAALVGLPLREPTPPGRPRRSR